MPEPYVFEAVRAAPELGLEVGDRVVYDGTDGMLVAIVRPVATAAFWRLYRDGALASITAGRFTAAPERADTPPFELGPRRGSLVLVRP